MKTLVLYSFYTDKASYFDDWIDAFVNHSYYNATCVNVCDKGFDLKSLRKVVESVDVLVLHHSMNGDTLKYLTPFISALKNRRGKLISFVGNEVNLPTISMASKIKILKDLDTDIIATQLLQEAGEWLYADCTKSRIIALPHALNPKAFYPENQRSDRKIDIGTRSARYGVYIGDNDRNNIIQFFHEIASKYRLCVDFGLGSNEQKRFNRKGWAHFLNASKATVSTEAGSFYLERDDKIVQLIQQHLQKTCNKFILPNETLLRKLYRNWVPSVMRKTVLHLLKNKILEVHNIDLECEFQEIYDKFFSKIQKCPVYSKAISSRHFDAIGTKTLHIMYPGRYNDILKPGDHYFALKHDHSNVDELLKLLQNLKEMNEITNRAYDFVLKEHTYKHRLDALLNSLNI